ncbi:hypothetical protein JL720_11847 [Aureococcus anophagefferens]|nr:hypothetical protein JL720_11847 [Aureococcus anophagefferens]
MGAAVATAKPLAEVDVKNDWRALRRRGAAGLRRGQEDDVVAWPKFKIARDQIEAIYDAHFAGAVCEIRWRGEELDDDWRQLGLKGTPAETLDELYAVANLAFNTYAEVMTAACPNDAVLKLAPLKGRPRAAAKARNEYAKNTAPATSWLFDVVRGSIMCATEDEIGEAGEIVHLCELQIHHAAIKESEPMHKSHVTYEFFREFFLGNADAVERRLNMLCALPVADAENVDDLVSRVLGSDRASDTKLLLELAELLESIAERASAVRVQEKVLEIKEREYGRDHVEVAASLVNLGNAYGGLGDYAKQRDLLVRALAIQEREYGGDHVQVAITLTNLGNAHGDLGDNARSATSSSARSRSTSASTAATTWPTPLHNLGNAYVDLGDDAKSRELLERALAIKEREYGCDHESVAKTLTNLGNAYGDLGDYAKKRNFLARARDQRARVRPRHVDVAITLFNLGTRGDLGDDARSATSSSARSRSSSASTAAAIHTPRSAGSCPSD